MTDSNPSSTAVASSPELKRISARHPAAHLISETSGKHVLQDLGDFELLEQIGQGAMGIVYKAHQKSLNRTVAVKVLAAAWAKDDVHIERFNREARAAAALSHPGIVQCISVGEHDGVHFLAMELLEGETVAQRLKREGKLPVADVIEIGRQIAQALAHAHSRGILHRDIKPANLMLMADSPTLSVKLMDLGLARTMTEDGSLTRAGIAMGTPFYISPEQARGVKALTPACDLYSLGIMLLHLVSGRLPYDGKTEADIMAQHVRNPVPEPKEFEAGLPDSFAALLRKLMAKDPADRIQSAEELAALLSRVNPVNGGGSRSRIKPARRIVKARRPRAAQASDSIVPGLVAAIVIVAAIVLTSSWQSRERMSDVRQKPISVPREIGEPPRTPEPAPLRPPLKKPAPSTAAAKQDPAVETAALPSLVGPQGKVEADE